MIRRYNGFLLRLIKITKRCSRRR